MAAPDPVQQKPIHSLIIDTGPLINNAVSISTIINSAEELYTTPAILSEIRDEATRSRVQTTLVPFLKIRTPSAASYDAVIAFSRKTGDYAVLSKQDLGILALAYEIHCERNGGDWGLREAPKQPIKRRPGEQEEKPEAEKNETEEQQIEKKHREPRQRKAKATKPAIDEIEEQPVVEAEEKKEEAEEQRVEKKSRKQRQREAKATRSAVEETDAQLAVEEEEKKDNSEKERKPRKPRQKKLAAREPTADEKEEQPAVEEGWEQPRGKRAIKSKYIKPAKEEFWQEATVEEDSGEKGDGQTPLHDGIDEQGGIAVTQEQILEQESSVELVESDIHGVGDQHEESKAVPATQDSTHDEGEQSLPDQPPAESEHKDGSSQELLKPKLESKEEISKQPAHVREISESFTAPADLEEDVTDLTLSTQPQDVQQATYDQLTPPATSSDPDPDSDYDSDGSWITPSNLPAHQAKDSGVQTHARTTKAKQIDVATMTTDFAMQNVLLQMNLHLISTNMQRIKHLSTKVLRCHACFVIIKQLDKQFCPRCGQATLQRVSCSTNSKGEFRVHLRKNYQFNTRGDKYSIPKPIAGTANGKWSGQGGGKGGWGRDLVLSEDQKEFQRSMEEEKRRRTRDLMDEDYLPGILTGERSGAGGKLKVGAGRNVNSRKKI